MSIDTRSSSSEGNCSLTMEKLTVYRDKVKEQVTEVTHRSNLPDGNNEELNNGRNNF